MADKKRIAHSFSRAADTYDCAAHLQRDIGQQLMSHITPRDFNVALDIGCGTGFFTSGLPAASVIGMDLAEGMVHFSRKQQPAIDWLCGDTENLPFLSNGIDLIFSNLAVQWCEDIQKTLFEMKRVLRPGGLAVVSTLVENTLQELRYCWQQVDDKPHVNYFLSEQQIKKSVKNADFKKSVITKQTRTLFYRSPLDMMRELKNLGAHEVTQRQELGMMGKVRFRRFLEQYEKLKQNEGFPATYDVVYMVLEK